MSFYTTTASKARQLTEFKRRAISSPPRYKSFLPIPPPFRDTVDQQRAEMPRKMPRFDQPEPGSEKLLWIHVPYTHTGWVPAILAKACGNHNRQKLYVALRIFRPLADVSSLEEFVNDEYWYSNLIRARHLEPHARYVRPECIHFKDRKPPSPDTVDGHQDPRLALYVSLPL